MDGVYVNGHGPYRFLVDTGANVNLIEANLARSIGLKATFQTDLASAAGRVAASGSDGNQIELDGATAGSQKFLFSGLESVRSLSPDIQGVLGQWFLSQFDYTLDLRDKRLDFGKREGQGSHIPLKLVNGREAVSTSLGDLILDSGAARVVLFGVQPDLGLAGKREWRTVAGSEQVGIVSGKQLMVGSRTMWRGDAVTLPSRPEPRVDGLLPLGLFKAIYVCNSEGYVVFE